MSQLKLRQGVLDYMAAAFMVAAMAALPLALLAGWRP